MLSPEVFGNRHNVVLYWQGPTDVVNVNLLAATERRCISRSGVMSLTHLWAPSFGDCVSTETEIISIRCLNTYMFINYIR